MTMITPNEVIQLIQASYPQAKVNLLEKGAVPSIPGLKRYSIQTTLFGSSISFNLGENLTLMIDDVPREVIKYLSLIHPDAVKATVQLWLKNLPAYLRETSIIPTKDLARTYLGQEEKVETKKNALYAYYDRFFVIIAPNAAFLCLKSDRRIVHHKRITSRVDLEDFFKVAQSFAQNIRSGAIK